MVVFEHIYLTMIKNLWHDALTSFMHLNYFKSILLNLGIKSRKINQIEFCSKYSFRFQKSLHSHWKFFVWLHFWFLRFLGLGTVNLIHVLRLLFTQLLRWHVRLFVFSRSFLLGKWIHWIIKFTNNSAFFAQNILTGFALFNFFVANMRNFACWNL